MYQYVYKFLIKYASKRNTRLWDNLWRTYVEPNRRRSVYIKVHGVKLLMNIGYTYPVFIRYFRSLNNPLLQLVYQVRKAKKQPLAFVDIGASIGDTVTLIESNIEDVFQDVICVDGDNEFFNYLKKNMASKPYVQCVNVLLTDRDQQSEKELLRIHTGSSSSQGNKLKVGTTLDCLTNSLNFDTIDVLKIDVDGFDGKVLKGAKKILVEMRPYIIFEWHPILIKQTNNCFEDAFLTLSDSGYTKFIFFSKYGNFSHYMVGVKLEELEWLNKLSLNDKHDYDWHYDIVALPPNYNIDPIELAECSYAKAKRNPV